jgi:hypothetical protein
MRFVLGIVVGAILVIGVAYIHDASIDPAKDVGSRAMVNWDVVSESLRGLNAWLHDEWAWLDEKFRGAN